MRTALIALLVCVASLLAAPGSFAHDANPNTRVQQEHGVCDLTGQPTAAASRGVMLFIHGGAWYGDREGVREPDPSPQTPEYEARFCKKMQRYVNTVVPPDWFVLAPSYTGTWSYGRGGGIQSLSDVGRWYDFINRNSNVPICVAGDSAGGHLALELANYRNPACVIQEGGATDIRSGAFVYDPSDPIDPDAKARRAFGDRRAEFSPILHPVASRIPVLSAAAKCDRFDLDDHARRYENARPITNTQIFGYGGADFVHADRCAYGPAIDGYEHTVRVLLNSVEQP